MMSRDSNHLDDETPLEIERTYLLNGMPTMPTGAERLRIEQGYLPERSAATGDHPEGRVRRMTMPDGSDRFEHTIKRGSGLVRSEQQRSITREEFDSLWPFTQDRRLTKTRYRIPCDAGGERRIWEIDAFDELNLVLAEVELPSEDASVTIPDWLQPHIVREVTDEQQYRIYELAIHLAKETPNRPNV